MKAKYRKGQLVQFTPGDKYNEKRHGMFYFLPQRVVVEHSYNGSMFDRQNGHKYYEIRPKVTYKAEYPGDLARFSIIVTETELSLIKRGE